jgi:hypothetical protein
MPATKVPLVDTISGCSIQPDNKTIGDDIPCENVERQSLKWNCETFKWNRRKSSGSHSIGEGHFRQQHANIPTKDYSLSREWTNDDKSQTLWFYHSFDDQQICNEMAAKIRSDPTQFHHLKLRYSLSSWQTKQTTISIDSVTSGSMVSKLLQKFG